MKFIGASSALFCAFGLTIAVVSASPLAITMSRNVFVPSSASVRDGDTIKICNSDSRFHAPLSLNKGNQFGNVKQINLGPGACTSQTMHNATGKPITIKIFDQLHYPPGVLTLTIAPRAGTVAADNWNGTFSDGQNVFTITASGTGLSGSSKWTAPGETFEKHGSTGTFSDCTVNGNHAHCKTSPGTYHDPDKSIATTGTVDLTLSGDTLTFVGTVTSATATWHVAPYTSAVHTGAVFTSVAKRQGVR